MPNFQVRFNQLFGSQTVYNISNWQAPSNSLATKQEFADAIRGAFSTQLAGYLHPTWSFQGMTFRQMDGGGAFSEEIGFTAGPQVGTATSNSMPKQLALLVAFSYLGPRPNRGRQFQAGFCEANNTDGGGPDSTIINALENMWQGFVGGVNTSAGAWFPRIARPNYTLNTWTLNNPIETVIARPIWSTVRKRKPGVGI